jgi:hypothetical protein
VDQHLTMTWARVEAAGGGPGAQHVRIRLEGTGAGAEAVCYPSLCGGPVRAGDRVLVNTTAADLGLGSGGFHIVVAAAERLPVRDAPGHIVKLRYTPVQLAVRSAAEEGAPGRPALLAAEGLAGMPVVAGSLHAQVAPAALAFALAAPGARLAYVMTDGGALPLALLQEVRDLQASGVLAAVITCGHAFGGDLEAAGLAGGLMAARWVAGCDAAIAAMGPGVVGTGTRWDTSALEQAALVDTVAGLGGRPIAIARVSFADPRRRHRGLSHHTRTSLHLARSAAIVPAPDARLARLLRQAEGIGDGRHMVVEVQCEAVIARVRERLPEHTSMGRGWSQEGALFSLAASAGVLAAEIALASRPASSGAPAGRPGARRR